MLNKDHKLTKLLYCIKVIRVFSGFRVFDTHRIYQNIQLHKKKNLDKQIKNDPNFAEDKLTDRNQITCLMMTNYALKILKLAIIILNASYFAGMFWLIFCELTLYINKNDAYLNFQAVFEKNYDFKISDCFKENLSVLVIQDCVILKQSEEMLSDTGFFLSYYALEDYIKKHGLKELKPLYDQAIIVMYWAFTTLSTVGFGDYNPRSDSERLMCAFFMLFGVAIFSYIMGIFIEILD